MTLENAGGKKKSVQGEHQLDFKVETPIKPANPEFED